MPTGYVSAKGKKTYRAKGLPKNFFANKNLFRLRPALRRK